MGRAENIRREIDTLIGFLIEAGLADDQNFAIRRDAPDGGVEITIPNAEYVSVALRERPYREIYDVLRQERVFNARLADGAMVQMMYVFRGDSIERHRLAYFPSPYLQQFEDQPEIYLQDEIFADVVSKAVVPFPVRFDCDMRGGVPSAFHHPKSHLSLGQYKNCRIPVSAPLTPFWFISFVLRSFYHTDYLRYAEKMPLCSESFDECIEGDERSTLHVQVPLLSR